MPQVIIDGPWPLGINSADDPTLLDKGYYPWAQNVVNTGGGITTRQGFAAKQISPQGPPRGITVFTPLGGQPTLVVALGPYIYQTPYPFTAPLKYVPGIIFNTAARNVHFEIGIQAQTTGPTGLVTVSPNPKPILMIQDGSTSAGYWDGTTAGHLSWSNKQCPIGTWMKWVGNRLWVIQNNKVYASDLLNPIQFTESFITATGGFFVLPDVGTGLGTTFDYKTLLAFTAQTTSAIQAGVTDRTQWRQVQDFQRVMFPNIGCSSGRSIINQYGITWWMSYNGLISLDNALQTYRSSRIHTKDQNMSRSKFGITNWQGGGCAGTFGNFLFFSVPSGSFYNVHTWIMDQSVASTMNQDLPPAWSANWTGIRPEEWVTENIKGQQRCFCVSYDPVPAGYQSTLWEVFIGQREDVPLIGGVLTPHDIACAFETKYLGSKEGQYSRFRFAELDLSEIEGNVRLEVFYRGRRTSYKSILKKRIYARPAGRGGTAEFNPDSIVGVSVPQSRVVRTVTDMAEESDNNPLVETERLRSIDREFSILVTWTGKMSLDMIRVVVDPIGQTVEGIAETDETTDRWVDAEGHGAIETTPAPANIATSQLTSRMLDIQTPKWVEFPSYDSATANAVFFVVQPVLTPAGGGYTDFPKTVYALSETVGTQIVYTRNGSDPVKPPSLNGTVIPNGGAITGVTEDMVIKARSFRSGMTDSSVNTAKYTRLQVAAPTFSPAAGSFDATEFPKTIAVATTTLTAWLRYTLNGVNPTPTLGTVISANHGNVNVGANQTLKAIAWSGSPPMKNSVITSGQFVARPYVATPTITPESGIYFDWPLKINLATLTAGATLKYTIDGSDPTATNGTLIGASNGSFNLVNSATVKVRAFKDGYTPSVITTKNYVWEAFQVAEPDFNPGAGHYGKTLNVTISTTTLGAYIMYTKDGTEPTASYGYYIGASSGMAGFSFKSPATRTLKAKAFKDGRTPSNTHQAMYKLGM